MKLGGLDIDADMLKAMGITITGADEPSVMGYYEPKIGTWIHRVQTPLDGVIEIHHGPLGRTWKVATIRMKAVKP